MWYEVYNFMRTSFVVDELVSLLLPSNCISANPANMTINPPMAPLIIQLIEP